jgi:acyl-CoA synthetase (AMP-forming)/AMP-acid ligase II
MNLSSRLARLAMARPDGTAIVDARGGAPRRWTYAALEREVAQAAGWLRAQGVEHGARILLLVPLSGELYVLLLALWRLGAAAVLVDPGAGWAFAGRCCARVRPDGLLGSPAAAAAARLVPGLRRIRLRVPVSRWPWSLGPRWWHEPVAAVAPPEGGDGAAAALITFTSGSTGVPRVVVRSHGLVAAQEAALGPALALAPDDVDLVTLPVFVLAGLAAGATSVLPALDLRRPGVVDGAAVAAQVEAHGITRCTASPAFFARLVAHCRQAGQALPSLRRLLVGGAPVLPQLLDGLREIAPRARIEAVYGSTEAAPMAHLNAAALGEGERAAVRGGAGLPAGFPAPAAELAVLPDAWGTPRGPLTDAELDALRLPPGARGEIVVRGPHVVPGHLDGEGDAETKFRAGGAIWHRTGDAGYFDARGRLWLLGRCAARIDDVRGRLYPLAVEAAAAGPGVARTALVAVDGRRVLAVEPEPGACLDRDRLRAALAWAELDEVWEVARLPVDRRHNARIDYPRLRRALGERRRLSRGAA